MNRYNLIVIVSSVILLLIAGPDGRCPCQDIESEDMNSAEFLEGSVNAPEFPFGLEWLNTDQPLTMADLRGKIVLLDFWTFCCINCMHIIPELKRLEAKYPDELVVIGVHSAKFTNEKDSEAIRQAILRYEIAHAVVNDNQMQAWSDYGVHAWPTVVLINPKGKIIGTHSGEGIYDVLDPVIQQTVDHFRATGELNKVAVKRELESGKQERTLLSFPGKIAFDTIGKRLLITDSNHNRVLITDPDGAIETVIGSGRNGSKDGTFADAEFNHPQGLCLDGDVLYIADTENHLIRAANLTTREVKTILGTGEQAHSFNVEGVGAGVALNSPWDVLTYNGKLYIAMAGSHQIWVADLQTLHAAPYAGSGREARIDGSLASAALAQPSGITSDGKKLYFTDSETSSIRAADLGGAGRVETIVGRDLFEYGDIDGGATVARLQHPLGIVYHDGLLYVADTYNSKIKVVDPVKKTATTFAGTGRHGFADGEINTAQFNEPSGLAFIGNSLYVADANNHRIRVIDLRTRRVGTLQFKNLDVVSRQAMQSFNGRVIRLQPQHLQAGQDKINLAIGLPNGYKFNDLAPAYLDWKSTSDKIVQFGLRADQVKFDPVRGIEIPLLALRGSGEIIFEAAVYFCKADASVCLYDNVRLIAPIIVDDKGPGRFGVKIDAKPLP